MQKQLINFQDIKSTYIRNNILSFLSEKQKLIIIIYNKKLQKMLSIDIKDYKKNTNKYKIGEKNGKGKEFLIKTNKLIFEGEYLNGKRNGKGKEYNYNGKLIFEGEYLNGQRNGRAKEYYEDGELKFEGEYLNRKRWNGKLYNIVGNKIVEIKNGTKMREYYDNGKLIFEGEYINGVLIGKEYFYFGNELEFEGEYLDGKRHGKGKEYYYNGKLIFEGEYIQGEKVDY